MIAEPMTDAELAALVAAPASASPYWVHRLAARDAAHLALVAARDAEVARLREALEACELWVTAALECKSWSWDFDQHAAATESRDAARAALAPRA